MADQPMTLGDALPREMALVRDEVLPHYLEIGTAGMFAVAVMRSDLDAAAKALAEGDIPLMMEAYKSLKGCKL
jgi:hypothetical protein